MSATARLRAATTTFGVVVVVVACIALAATTLALAATPAGAAGPHNQFLAVQVGYDGQFNIGAYPAADGSQTTGSWDLSYRWGNSPWSSFSTVRVDGSAYRCDTSLTVVKVPTDVDATSNVTQWKTTTGILVTQRLSLVTNSATGRQDVAQIEYTVKNTGTAAHSVGLRLMIDTEINYNDHALFRVPGVGALTTQQEFTGAAVPRGIYVFDTPSDTTHIAFVADGFAGPAPNRIVFGRWPSISSSTWDYVVDPTLIIGDSAYVMYWDPTTLGAGQSRTYISSYGLGASSFDLRPPLALGVYGPSQLGVVNGAYSPNPFDVSAWVSDVGTVPASNVQAKIVLPAGLELVSGSPTQTLGALAVNQEKQASWSVRALPNGSASTLSYEVTVWGDNTDPKTVTRTLAVPAVVPTVTLNLSGLTGGALKLGKSVTAKGTVKPTSLAGSKVKLTVQTKRGTKWVKLTSTARTISASAAYIWGYKPARKGAYRIQATIAKTAAHTAAASPWCTFNVN